MIKIEHVIKYDEYGSKVDVNVMLNVYRMLPSHPELDCFEINKSKLEMYYDTEEILAEYHQDGRGRWFYRNGN